MENKLLVFCKIVFLFFLITDCATAASVVERDTGLYDSQTYPENDDQAWITCESQIYCQGELLHDVQLMHLFKDSKTFVDFKLRYPEKKIIEKYKELKHEEHGHVSREKLQKFVEENFESGNELEAWQPTDWVEEPSVLEKIQNPQYKKWASYLNIMWRVLARRVKEEVHKDPSMYSLVFVPNGFVIPGGRFTELYYWDTYWIINGLLLCDMNETVKGVIDNLIHLVKLFGHVPNGSRVYYISRSQPPLLIQMVNNYYKHTKDWDFVKNNIKHLDTEFQYWWDNHMVKIEKDKKIYKLARYFSNTITPRPESYREDYLVAQGFNTTKQQEEFYVKIRSAAETGWDFSSRWFVKGKTNEGNLTDVATPQIIPVDLNSFLQLNAELLCEWYAKLGDMEKAKAYKRKANLLLESITGVLWHDDVGIWLDYDSANKVRRNYFYISNFTPLFTNSYFKTWSKSVLSKKIMNYIQHHNLEEFTGGVPTSLEETGEQWDFPNAWAPIEAIMIDGLANLDTDNSKSAAYRIASKWLQSNYKGYAEQQVMYEKYDVLRPGETGEGGEYVPQTGFGWTNGVVLELLNKYGDRVEPNVSEDYVEGYKLPHEKNNDSIENLIENSPIEKKSSSIKQLFLNLEGPHSE